MKTIIIIFVFLVSCVSFLHAQVNFHYEFSFDKLDNDDELVRTYLFDYNNDGIDNYAVEYGYNEPYGLFYTCNLGIYDHEGILIDTLYADWHERYYVFENSYSQNREFFINVCDDSLFINLIDYDTGIILDSIRVINTVGHFFTFITDVNSLVNNDTTYIFIGAMKKWNYLGAEYFRSYLFTFKIIDDEFFYLEDIENCGFKSITTNNKHLSIGLYYQSNDYGVWGSEDFDYYLKTISIEEPIAIYPLHHVEGSEVYSTPHEWIHCPVNYTILTKNPQSEQPHILYYQQYDSDDGDSLLYYAYDLANGQEEWTIKQPLSEYNLIIASTCVSVNEEDHHVMYFYDNNTLEIRNRLNGNIVHQQDSVFVACDILRKSDGELLFFVEKDDETGYDVYALDGPIFVSADDTHTQNEIFIEQYPNPFRSSTTLSFSSKEHIHNAEIKIYNIKGQLVRKLRFNAFSLSRFLEVNWDGKDKNGKNVAEGIYLYKIKTDNQEFVGKIVKVE